MRLNFQIVKKAGRLRPAFFPGISTKKKLEKTNFWGQCMALWELVSNPLRQSSNRHPHHHTAPKLDLTPISNLHNPTGHQTSFSNNPRVK